MTLDRDGLRALLTRPILDLHGGYRCCFCAGAIGAHTHLASARMCDCPKRDE